MSTSQHSAPAPPQPQDTPLRLYFADNLRVFLTVLVVLHHLTLTYAVVAPWYYVEYRGNGLGTLLGLGFVLLNQAYFMGLFFFLAGYFTPGAYDKKGGGAFVRGRLLRLGVPLVGFLVLVQPVAGLGGVFAKLPPGWDPPPPGGPLDALVGLLGAGPLWFVEVLLLLALGYVGWRAVSARARRGVPAPLVGDAAGGPPRYRTVGLFVLALAAATWVTRLVMPIGFTVPVLSWPTPAYLPQYVSFFAVGVLAYRRNWLHHLTDRMGRVGLLAAVGASVVLLPVVLLDTDGMGGGVNVSAAAYALWDSTLAVGWSMFLLTFFRRRLNAQGRLRRFAADHAFAVYVLHAAVITWLAVALRGVQLNPMVKFALVAPVAVVACFAVAYLVRRIAGVKKVL